VVQLERGGGTHVRPAGAAALNVKRASRTDGSTVEWKGTTELNDVDSVLNIAIIFYLVF